MKKFVCLICLTVVLASCSEKELMLNEKNVKKIVAAMTLDEKITLVVGSGGLDTGNGAMIGMHSNIVPGAAGSTVPITRLGIPAITFADGPAGLHIKPTRPDDEKTYYCTGFPVGTVMACTWNTDLVHRVGGAMGAEVREYGVDVILAPGNNLQRNPLCGRNFEYYSEDPLLSGKIAAAMIAGIQNEGVGTSLKHFAVNNQETNRVGNDARLSERALREIYLRPFEIAVKEARPWTIMSSYNIINGQPAAESRELLNDILREEWGFDGAVMTDWGGGRDAVDVIKATNDLIMPGAARHPRMLREGYESGRLKMKDLDVCVGNILNVIVRSPSFKRYKYSNEPDMETHAKITRQSAAEGMVLLKNNGGALPLKDVRNVALFGTASYDFIAGGTGSGHVNKPYVVGLQEGLSNNGFTTNEELKDFYESYIAREKSKPPVGLQKLMALFTPNWQYGVEEISVPEEMILSAALTSDIAVLTISRQAGEGTDRRYDKGDWLLNDTEHSLLISVAAAFHSVDKKVVVIMNIGGAMDTAGWNELPDAILCAWQCGQEGGNSVADILSGRVNPSGKLSMTFPVDYMDTASSENFPYDYVDNSVMGLSPEIFAPIIDRFPDVVIGENITEGPNIGYTDYEEDIYVGYRYFDTFGKEVCYPFGYGLSYTIFDYSASAVKGGKKGYEVRVTVTNTGDVAGKEVVQVYACAPDIPAGVPAQQLVAFGKTKLLAPGESQQLVMSFTERDLAWYDSSRSAWVLNEGEYGIRLSASSRDVRAEHRLTVKKEKVLETTHNNLEPQVALNLLHP